MQGVSSWADRLHTAADADDLVLIVLGGRTHRYGSLDCAVDRRAEPLIEQDAASPGNRRSRENGTSHKTDFCGSFHTRYPCAPYPARSPIS